MPYHHNVDCYNKIKTKSTIFNSNTITVRGLALSGLFSSMFFGWSMFHNPFLHPHSSAYPIFHALDFFKLYTNTSNCSLCTLLLFYNNI